MCPFSGRSAVSLIPALTASANVVLYEGVGVFDPQPQPRLVMPLPRARMPGMIDRVGHDGLGHATLSLPILTLADLWRSPAFTLKYTNWSPRSEQSPWLSQQLLVSTPLT